MNHRRQLAAVLATVVMCASVLFYTYGRGLAARSVPGQLSDKDYWQLVEDFSEPNGYFRSDNLLSNENTFQHVIPALQSKLPADGVYLGVGPEQNFTYIAALKPRLAFIVDIRRGNMNLQLLYKAFMELSRDRAEFLSRLFARPRPPALSEKTSVEELIDAYELAAPSEELYHRYLQEATDHLTKAHRFTLTADDLRGIEYVYNAFFKAGPDLNYSFSGFPFGGGGGFRFPTYAVLMTERDGAGQHRSYLATEENYRAVADMERRNAIIAITGDFAGPKALRAVGRYLKAHDATVTAIYTSNVEQYLFQSDTNWKKYYANIATLPIDARSTFIRSVSNRGYSPGPNGPRAQTRLCSVADLLQAFNRGQITGYYDVIAMSK